MPARETTIPRPPMTREPCPACGWLSSWLGRLGFKVGERVRIVEAHRLVVILAGDTGDDRELADEPIPWPWVLAQAAAQNPPPEKGGKR